MECIITLKYTMLVHRKIKDDEKLVFQPIFKKKLLYFLLSEHLSPSRYLDSGQTQVLEASGHSTSIVTHCSFDLHVWPYKISESKKKNYHLLTSKDYVM
jgi:hypothetical protein